MHYLERIFGMFSLKFESYQYLASRGLGTFYLFVAGTYILPPVCVKSYTIFHVKSNCGGEIPLHIYASFMSYSIVAGDGENVENVFLVKVYSVFVIWGMKVAIA